MLALGLPLGVIALADGIRPARGAVLAAVPFIVAIAIDFAIVGVVVPPPAIVLDRTILAVGLGALAAGSATDGRRRRWLLVAGGLAWCWGLLVALGLGLP